VIRFDEPVRRFMGNWQRVVAVLCLACCATAAYGCQGDRGPAGPPGKPGPQGPPGESAATVPAVIRVVVNPVAQDGKFLAEPALANGMPLIQKGDKVSIYGAGFAVGERVTLDIADSEHGVDLGSLTVENKAGAIVWEGVADWPRYKWMPDGHRYGVLKAKGDRGSVAVAFVNIGLQ
jgi:hypothetical protein